MSSTNSTLDPVAQALIRGLAQWPVLRLGDLGCFLRKEQPARWDPEQGIIYPPTVALDFVRGFASQPDFVQYLVEKEGCSLQAARELAYKLQKQVVQALADSGKFHFPGLGSLSQTASGEFSFHTDEQALQTLDIQSFGLKKVKAARKSTASALPVSQKNHEMNTLSKEKPAKDRLFGWKFFLVVVLMGALSGLVLQYGPWDLSSVWSSQQESPVAIQPPLPQRPIPGRTGEPVTPNNGAASQGSEAASNKRQGTAKAPSANDTPDTSLFADAGTTRGAAPRASEDMPGSPVGDMGVFRGGESQANARILPDIQNYHLIAASFNQVSRAEEFVLQLKSEGYDAVILIAAEGSGEPHRVSIYRDSNRQKVAAYAEKLKQTGRLAGWVYAERASLP